ncbi:hypothetical protein [Sulfitobacter sp. MF3-043]|uniref:hypothetical protein n=1 Tax=Sulfitobacter sediminivivens TaxID=3252902 RepID=UPI0036DF383D
MPGSAANFFELSLVLQIALGSGYLAYATSYAGLRRDHNIGDQLSISLVFSAIALILANSTASWDDGWRVAFTLVSTMLVGVIWRAAGRPIWHWFLRKTGIHREDGVHSGWAALVQTKKGVSQATVYTQDGRILHLSDRAPYENLEWGGLYLCGDGSVTMIVESDTDAQGSEILREDITDLNWGTRYTHIPADQIRRVELRLK